MLVYPLGMTLLLLAVGAVIGGRRPSAARICCIIALIVLLFASTRWASFALAAPLESRCVPPVLPVNADAIVVLGGTTEPAFKPQPNVHVMVADRLVYAAMLYHMRKAPFVIASGGRFPWAQGARPEADDMSQILQLMGVPDSAILEESVSANTYQEAVAVKHLMDARHLHTILLVTSAMHMPRALGTFRHQGIDAIPSPTDFVATEDKLPLSQDSIQGFILSSVPDPKSLMITTYALKEYLGLAYYWARRWM